MSPAGGAPSALHISGCSMGWRGRELGCPPVTRVALVRFVRRVGTAIPERSIRNSSALHQCILCTGSDLAMCAGFRRHVIYRMAHVWHQHGHVVVNDTHVETDPFQRQYVRSPDGSPSHLQLDQSSPPQSQATRQFFLCQLPFMSERNEFICFHGAIASVLKFHLHSVFQENLF